MAKLSFLEKTERSYRRGNRPNIKNIVKYFVELDIANITKSAYISKFKSKLKNIRDDKILDKLLLPRDLSEEVFQTKQNRFNEKENLIINKEKIDKLLSYEDSDNFYNLALFLLLQCGRRLSEFLNLKVLSGNTENSLNFTGQLKTANQKHYNIPLLSISYLKFDDLYDKMNKLKPNIGNDLLSKNLRIRLKNIFDNDKITIHDLRRIYAVMCYEKYGNNEIIANYIQKILGHENNLSSIHYNTIKIIE